MARPSSYRAELLGPLCHLLAAGECCSVVGMSGVGKTNAIQQLARPEVHALHRGPGANPPVIVLVDSNLMPVWSPWGLFEGWLAALANAELGAECCTAISALHAEVLAAPDQYSLAVRRCTEALRLACAAHHVVTVFDEFDSLFAELPAIAVRNLRGLRDSFKYRLCYLTFTRQRLVDLRGDDEWDAVEPFVELLTAAEFGLGPLADSDAAAEAERIAARLGIALASGQAPQIAVLSGGHPALIRVFVTLARSGVNLTAAPQTQLANPLVRQECMKIWEQLSDDEQEATRELLLGGATPSSVGLLRLKGIARADGTLFSPLLAQYVRTLGSPVQQEDQSIFINIAQGSVRYYGLEIGGELSELEFRLLSYLWQHYGQICPHADVARAVYQSESALADTDGAHAQRFDFERLRLLARRLRQRLDRIAREQPRLFTIIKGRGYRLGFPPPSS